MTKQKMLYEMWEFLQRNNFSKNYWGEYEELAKQKFFNKGMKTNKKDLESFYNLFTYGYFCNDQPHLYYKLCNL